MTIYNRWGELIFETNNSEIGWDGSYGVNGRKVQEGSIHIISCIKYQQKMKNRYRSRKSY